MIQIENPRFRIFGRSLYLLQPKEYLQGKLMSLDVLAFLQSPYGFLYVSISIPLCLSRGDEIGFYNSMKTFVSGYNFWMNVSSLSGKNMKYIFNDPNLLCDSFS